MGRYTRREAPPEGPPADTYLAIGKVVKVWGLKGHVKVYSYAESLETFRRTRALFTRTEAGVIPLPIESSREHKGGVLLKFRRRDSVEDVEELVGQTLYLEKKDLPELEEGEYYWHELLGMEVRTEEDRLVGRLVRILETGGNDVYVVRKGEKENLIPAIREVVRKVDVAAKRMIIRPLEGLLDLDEDKDDDL